MQIVDNTVRPVVQTGVETEGFATQIRETDRLCGKLVFSACGSETYLQLFSLFSLLYGTFER